MTYQRLRALAAALPTCPALTNLPVGSRICASLPAGRPELAALFLSVTAGGRFTFCPLNPDLSEDECAFELSDCPAAARPPPPSRARSRYG